MDESIIPRWFVDTARDVGLGLSSAMLIAMGGACAFWFLRELFIRSRRGR